MADTYALYIVPQSEEVSRSEQYPFNWEQSPVSGYIGGDLFAFVTDDDDDEANEAGTQVYGALRDEQPDIYGTLGVVRTGGEPLDDLDVAFVEALIADHFTVREVMPSAGDLNLVATTLDWRTLSIEGIPDDGSDDTPENAIQGAPYVNNGYLVLDDYLGDRTRVALVERGYIDVRHLHGYLDDRFGRASTRRVLVNDAAHAYRESEHWRLSTWSRILTEGQSEESITLMLKSATEGVPEEYLFAAQN